MKKLLKKIKKIKKRHSLLVLIGVLLYLCAKIYVLNTRLPIDDDIPDQIVDSLLFLVDGEAPDTPGDPINNSNDGSNPHA